MTVEYTKYTALHLKMTENWDNAESTYEKMHNVSKDTIRLKFD